MPSRAPGPAPSRTRSRCRAGRRGWRRSGRRQAHEPPCASDHHTSPWRTRLSAEPTRTWTRHGVALALPCSGCTAATHAGRMHGAPLPHSAPALAIMHLTFLHLTFLRFFLTRSQCDITMASERSQTNAPGVPSRPLSQPRDGRPRNTAQPPSRKEQLR